MAIKRAVALLSLAIVLTGASRAHSENQLMPRENSVEASTDSVVLPSTPSGSIVIRTCMSCIPSGYQVNSQTQYLIGKDAVGFQEFIAFAHSGGPYTMTVFFDRTAPVIIRLKLNAQYRKSRN